MRTPLLLGSCLLAALGARPADRPIGPRDEVVRGSYVEARTASVFAGPCHYNGEYTTQGRGALVAWRIESGRERGVDLAGVSVVAAIVADRNLAEPEAKRRSIVYLPAELPGETRDAARAWVLREHRAVLGTVAKVSFADVTIERAGDRFAVAAGRAVELRGEAMPDRACCSMPSGVWYEPLAPVQGRVVGFVETAAFRGGLGRTWVRADENSAFVATFPAEPDA